MTMNELLTISTKAFELGAYRSSDENYWSRQHRAALARTARRVEEYFHSFNPVVVIGNNSITDDAVEFLTHGGAMAAVDDIGIQLYRDQFEAAVTHEITHRIAGIEASTTPHGVQIVEGGKQIALVKVTRAVVYEPTKSMITGNFVVPDGDCWDDLRRRLGAASMGGSVVRHLPAAVAEPERLWMLKASDRIRTERSSHWGLDVLVREEHGGARIIFRPAGIREHLEVPFEYVTASGYAVPGALRLGTAEGVLDMVVASDLSEELVIETWAFAVGAFADLTCGADAEPESARAGEVHELRPRVANGNERRPTTIPRQRAAHPTSRPSMSDRMSPMPATAKVLTGGHYVAAHKCRLRPPSQASPEQRAIADALGIRLGAHETWRREHVRGLAGETPTLEFIWRRPGVDDRHRIAQAA